MKNLNTKEFVDSFCDMVQEILNNCKEVGYCTWGDPAGLKEGLLTYEVKSDNGESVWCSIVEWVRSNTDIVNRKGLIVTFPKKSEQSLGQIINIVIPYKFSRIYNTRAFSYNNKVEIRNYGKVTVGRNGKGKVIC